MSTPNSSTESDKKATDAIIFGWWKQYIGPRELAGVRALAARLNRADSIDALSEPAVHELMHRLDWQPTTGHVQALLRLARVLPTVREHTPQTSLAQRLGAGEPPAMSSLRFQSLLRADGDDLITALRRALLLADRCCNVAALGHDLVCWNAPGDRVRTRWCFEYFGAMAPTSVTETSSSEEETA